MSRFLVFIVVLAGFTALASSGPAVSPAGNAARKLEAVRAASGPARKPNGKTTPPCSYLQALLGRVDFPGEDDPKTTLLEVLNALAKKTGVAFDINEKAFKYEMLNDVQKTEVANPNAIPPMKASLGAVLKKILERVPVPSGATYLLREDCIEITTGEFALAECRGREKSPSPAGTNRKKAPAEAEKVDEGRLLTIPSVVSICLDRQPLEEAIRQMRAQTNFNFVFEPGLGEKAKPSLTVTLLNVPVDSALRVLTEMLELDYVWLDNLFYLTSQDRAKKLRTTWPRRRGGGDLFIRAAADAGP